MGTFRSNAFGLHDVMGNLAELCRDRLGDYEWPVEPGDGERTIVDDDLVERVVRGGSFADGVAMARSASREAIAPGRRLETVGLRPARRMIR